MQRFRAKLSSKNQISLPAQVRQVLGVGPGDRVLFEIADDKKVTLRAAPRLTVRELKGIVPAIDRAMSDDFDIEIEEAMRDMAERELGPTPVR